jgi:membrane protease YdiL (CAAX protease family)
MAFESCLFAFLLWQFSRNFGPILDQLGVKLQIVVQTAPVSQILTYIGAGIYEEVLFRLVLFIGLYAMLRFVRIPFIVAVPVAAVAAALAFAAAHHIGPYAEPMRADWFVFRACAGLFFTILFVLRGFGIAIGAHIGYDVLVGVTIS